VADPAQDWLTECERRSGTYPIQVVPEGNAAAHVQDTEARPQKRAFTLEELQDGEPPRQVRRLQP
jgi:integrase/recombinase XerC